MNAIALEASAGVVHRFATLGDSITGGTSLDDCRLWPQLVTDWLATHISDVRHLNFAVDGAMSSDVVKDQVPAALESRPDLVTVLCGANDVLHHPRPDIDAAGANLTECLRLLAEGVPLERIVAATYPDFVPLLPWRPRSKARVATGLARLNELIRLAAREIDILCVDLAAWPRRYSDEAYAPDGVHPSQIGHQRIAIAMTLALAPKLKLPDARPYWEAIYER